MLFERNSKTLINVCILTTTASTIIIITSSSGGSAIHSNCKNFHYKIIQSQKKINVPLNGTLYNVHAWLIIPAVNASNEQQQQRTSSIVAFLKFKNTPSSIIRHGNSMSRFLSSNFVRNCFQIENKRVCPQWKNSIRIQTFARQRVM